MRALSLYLATAVLALPCAPDAADDEPVSVWIVPFDVLGDGDSGDDLGLTIADLLTVALSRVPEFSLLDRPALAEVLAERFEKDVDSEKLLWARWMLHGTALRRGDELTVTAHVTDVASTRVLGSARASGRVDALPEMVSALKTELTEIARTADRSSGSGELDTAPVANLHFMRGLSRYHQGRYHRALAEFIRSGADPEVEDLSSLWRANCYLAVESYDHAFLELLRLQRTRSGRVRPEALQPLLDECLEHLSSEQVRSYREL